MKRILALDGGGIRGVFSLEILLHIQKLLREHFDSPDLVLADHFDFFAGTSTGAIIAACLCWGRTVEDILDLYVKYGQAMFQPVPWYRPVKRLWISRFEAKPLSDILQRLFSEDGEGNVPALLGTERLKKLLLVVVRNHTTGSAWPLTNNPKAMFNDRSLPDCNLNVPLWQLVRASTAAPVYFPPEEILLGDTRYVFVDGGLTPYNNPALMAALTAVLPGYRLEWESGPDKIRLISVGTLRFSAKLPEQIKKLSLLYNVSRIPAALIETIAWQQDYLCRCLGECLYGEQLDVEIKDLLDVPIPGRNWFSYVRYNNTFKGRKLEELLKKDRRMGRLDAVHTIPALREIGRDYAQEHVRIEHLI